MSARLVILGGAGLLGTVLAAQARADGRDVASLTSAACDVTDATAPGRHIRAGDVVINCAAYTRVDDAERDRARAHAVNATGAGNVARACAAAGADLLHVSTDYVFDGDFGGAAPQPYETDDATHPLSVYGATKLAGEREVHAALPDATVVRTAWIFVGGNGTDFAAVMRRNAIEGAAVEVVADQIGSPTYAVDLASTLLSLADRRPAARVLHAANAGPASRYDQACAVYELVGADPRLVTPVGSEEHPRPAPRPTYSALGAQRSAAAGVAPLRPWRDALAAALAVPLTGR
ncbi:dTDP-4-dehydrorhamnose reductase [Mycolicibacterium grossiae]|uniref:dTDP-4-dehydrorhamnose reductase n=1 Tax=Mycolicibacterium grossiae TaxID=1552759 RepID=A0A1E8PWE8_9MYCO|nr:dTDP-4-dehydrorhamnose reductase [Mycolicibacterium grossiae]OFJ50662.1 dTDP-4-dehydrorhamnose reductase [Mycolicibacterium grossiae]QEM45593.1 dTDP-4-dehydrorhamnose reductase [Mycolicibacterium grossiae]